LRFEYFLKLNFAARKLNASTYYIYVCAGMWVLPSKVCLTRGIC